MTNKRDPIRQTIQTISALYVPTPAYQTLEARFRELLEQRRADAADGRLKSAMGIVLVGQSGSGKTTAVEELVRNNRDLLATNTSEEICEFFSLEVPSPATMKFVGAATLRALGYPYSGDKQGPVIWDRVKVQLQMRQTCFLHYDEAQDLARYQTDKERQAVVNTLKSVMGYSEWPTGLILSGMPDLKKIVNQDVQLARRFYPVEIDRLNDMRDVEPVLDIVQKYASRATIEVCSNIRDEQFAQRLMHAADYEFGLMAELIVQSISRALLRDGFDAVLGRMHFADVFHERTAAHDSLNPFLAENFTRIEARRLFTGAG